ncbi:L-histidine N(alpha)-methyltransferase [Candidatus Fermentibacteria bacterium]|nr:L-histidine N(alpha)-methyltransferase [Candidatus Fermentibacteria bacterium]
MKNEVVDGIEITDHLRRLSPEQVREEILSGLLDSPRSLPSKYFYDQKGSRLFEDITKLDEYYLTDTEKGIMRRTMPLVVGELSDADVIELGSGDCSKISILLESIPEESRSTIRYVPVDVSRAAIVKSAVKLRERFPRVRIQGLVANFHHRIEEVPDGHRKLFCFFGSTIGNLGQAESESFLAGLSEVMRPADRLLLGLDMVKEVGVLESAYNDSKGITAAFNRNILDVVNRLVQTDFRPREFDHSAFFNSEVNRIEMHLVPRRNSTVHSPYLQSPLEISSGETIHTENSYKYTPDSIESFCKKCRLNVENIFMDEREWFSLVELAAD